VIQIGNYAVALALAFCAYAIFALFYGAKTGRREIAKSGERAVYATFAFVTLAIVSLSVRMKYVDAVVNGKQPVAEGHGGKEAATTR